MSKSLADVLALSKKILNEYDVCDQCLGRLFAKKLGLLSNKKLGQKIHKMLHKKTVKCYVCKNIFEVIPHYVEKMQNLSSDYAYSSFLVGAKLKPSILDRDDHLRSQFKLRGIDGIKTSLTHEMAKQFVRKTKKKWHQQEPDLTFTVDFKQESCEIQSKPVFVFGRYTKVYRNTPQKQKPCSNCLGKGCTSCNYHGITEYDSVEGNLSRYFFEKFGALQAKLTWVGGEDSTSLVLGSGRPFFARLTQPKKRHMKLAKKIPLEKITLHGLKEVDKIPQRLPHFVSKSRLLVTCENPIHETLSALLQLKGTITVYENSGKRSEKTIHDVSYEKNSENSFYLSLLIDGGVPLKRLISGENVFPNVTDLLQNKCRCETFDFEKIILA
jgi:tRNA pseudouridine synthase 10